MVFEAGASVWTTCPSDVCGVVQRDNLWTILCVPCACLWCNETSPLRLCGKKGARERELSRPSSEDVCRRRSSEDASLLRRSVRLEPSL